MSYFPTRLYEAGFTDLISVIPPGAALTPTSKIQSTGLGKTPGRKLSSGLWAGYDWRATHHTANDVAGWATDGANVGLRSTHFPAVDIDILDEGLANVVKDCALAVLGPAPIRYGRRPKQLLVYRTDEPFGRMRLVITAGDAKHLVEILGSGQQYLVHGIHPGTMSPYHWEGDLASTGPLGLSTITREQADRFLTELTAILEMLGAGTVKRIGSGSLAERTEMAQDGLAAPSLDDLAEAVRHIPNTDELFPVRDDYIAMGIAIRAAGGDEAFGIFAQWAGKRAADGRVAGNPDTWLSDWRRMNGPFSIGWNFLADLARRFGYDTTAHDFEATGAAPVDDGDCEAPAYSDQWLSDKVVAARAGELRYVPLTGTWIVWDSARWQPDAELLAENIVNQELRKIAARLARTGSTPKEQRDNEKAAVALCSAGKATAVRSVMQSNRAVAVSMPTLDHDQWLLNTPGGIVDLKTGELRPSDPDALCTKSTSVAPAFGAPHPEFDRFLLEATNGDLELIGYLQRMAGYTLTGSTREQNLTFIWGKGGNGKGTFLNVLIGILADYWRSASMDTFTASTTEKHTTDIAMLSGSRLVTASETQAGKRWDEQKVKALTGGDPITARFMRQDNFTYTPHFKLVFIGNHKPEIRDVDDAMRRRIQMVPFNTKPKVVDNMLDEKLKAEWPAILAWMIDGCLAWQRDGLQLPASVKATTAEYFQEEDALGRWIAECCELGEGSASLTDLFVSWREWANMNGEYPGSLKRLSGALAARQLEKVRDPVTRRRGFAGIVVNRQDLGILNT